MCILRRKCIPPSSFREPSMERHVQMPPPIPNVPTVVGDMARGAKAEGDADVGTLRNSGMGKRRSVMVEGLTAPEGNLESVVTGWVTMILALATPLPPLMTAAADAADVIPAAVPPPPAVRLFFGPVSDVSAPTAA